MLQNYKKILTLSKDLIIKNMKLKRHITVPLLLLAYLIGISVYAWPPRNPGISFTQYWLTIAISLACIVVLSYFLKKRDGFRDKNRNRG